MAYSERNLWFELPFTRRGLGRLRCVPKPLQLTATSRASNHSYPKWRGASIRNLHDNEAAYRNGIAQSSIAVSPAGTTLKSRL
jgi:hypothetical protein